jgi:hypothetical protein
MRSVNLEGFNMAFSESNRSRGFLNVIFLFLAVFLLVVTAGLKPSPATKASVEDEYKAQQKFMQLQSSVDSQDYTMSQFILSNFQRDYSDTDFYKQHSKLIDENTRKIKSGLKGITMRDKIEYLFVPPRLDSKIWKEFMSKAERIVSQGRSGTGIAVVRVILEDESLEPAFAKVDRNSTNDLVLYSFDGGYSVVHSFKSGDALLVGSGFWRYNSSDSNDKNVSAIGDIIIGGIYHYPIKLKITVQKGKAVPFGEVIVRTIPKEFCGNLKVNVKAEGDAQLKDARITLSRSGVYDGITMPLKDNSCLFSSVGLGGYGLKVVSPFFGGPDSSASVVPGQTTEVTINAYRSRMIELDWRFRRTNEPNNWVSGQKVMKTKEYWQPDDEWNVHYPVIDFGDWIGNACKIRTSNGDLMYVDTNGPFEKMDFPLNFNAASYHGCSIKEGDIFAWRRDRNDSKEGILRALIRIRKITPVGLPQDQNSSVQENKSD